MDRVFEIEELDQLLVDATKRRDQAQRLITKLGSLREQLASSNGVSRTDLRLQDDGEIETVQPTPVSVTEALPASLRGMAVYDALKLVFSANGKRPMTCASIRAEFTRRGLRVSDSAVYNALTKRPREFVRAGQEGNSGTWKFV